MEIEVDSFDVDVVQHVGGAAVVSGTGDRDGFATTIEVDVTGDVMTISAGPRGGTLATVLARPAPAWVASAYLRAERLPDAGDLFAPPIFAQVTGDGLGSPRCAAERLVDPFDALDPLMWRWTSGCLPSADGTLSVPMDGSGPGACCEADAMGVELSPTAR